MTLATIGLLIGALVSLAAALTVRFAGEARVFNMIDYRGRNAVSLNAAVGRRLMTLPLGFVVLSAAAARWPSLDLLWLGGSLPLTIIVAAWSAGAQPKIAS